MTHRFVRVVLSVTALAGMALSAPVAQAAWDAAPVPDRYYPNTRWERHFAAQPDVVARGSIDAAIQRCDDVVGANRYCVVQIADSAPREPVYLTRSRTKLVGFEGMAPLRSHDNEAVIMVESNTRQVVLENLHIRGHRARDQYTYGIWVIGESISGVVIRNNRIEGLSSWYGAHGIAVYGQGNRGVKSVRNVLITDNTLRDLETGWSESIAINGNVMRWAVVDNRVTDVNNIAIDAIGGEGTSPTRTVGGRVVPGAYDRARYGFILDNHVENMSTLGNRAYGNQRTWAAGIYIDGGLRIKVAGNTVKNAPWAYEIGAENCLVTQHITLENNTADGSWYGDLVLGGYEPIGFNRDRGIDCNPLTSSDADDEGHGLVSRIRTQNNQFNSSGHREDKILPQYRVRGAVMLDPGVAAVNTHRNGYAPGDENAILTQEP